MIVEKCIVYKYEEMGYRIDDSKKISSKEYEYVGARCVPRKGIGPNWANVKHT